MAITMLSRLFFVALCAAAIAFASPVKVREPFVTLPLARHFNATGPIPMAQKDQERIQALVQGAQGNAQRRNIESTSLVLSPQDFYYTVQLGISVPPTWYTLILDIGSSNTWVGARGYNVPPTSVFQGDVSVSWRSGFWNGEEYQDTITVIDSLYEGIQQSYGVATKVTWNGPDVDGVLGLGPEDLTCGTLSTGECIPTVSQNYYQQGFVDAPIIAISLDPYGSTIGSAEGSLVLGGTTSGYPYPWNGSLNYVPLTTTAPASKYIGIDQSITYGSSDTPILELTAGMIDTATTLIYLATDAFEAYQAATGAVMDWSVNMLRITTEQYANLQTLYFHIGDVTYEFIPDAQIWPRTLNVAAGGVEDAIYLPFGDLGTPSGSGLDFVNGMVWLQRYYLVYDTGYSRVGLALTDTTYGNYN